MTAPESQRLSVNINPETATKLRELAEKRDVSVTEAVRRAVSIAAYIEGEFAKGNTILIKNRISGNTRQLEIL